MYTLYSMQRSGNSYKVRLALAKLATPYRLHEVDILKGESHTPEDVREHGMPSKRGGRRWWGPGYPDPHHGYRFRSCSPEGVLSLPTYWSSQIFVISGMPLFGLGMTFLTFVPKTKLPLS